MLTVLGNLLIFGVSLERVILNSMQRFSFYAPIVIKLKNLCSNMTYVRNVCLQTGAEVGNDNDHDNHSNAKV